MPGQPRLSADQLARFSRIIHTISGIRLEVFQPAQLDVRIRRLMSRLGLDDLEGYLDLLEDASSHNERDCLLEVITTNETMFFRLEEHFRWLTDVFIPGLLSERLAGKRPPQARFWSAGCATGAEAYSIAICLGEHSERFTDWHLEIVGTDISAAAIEKAHVASYDERAVAFVHPARRLRFFTHDREDNRWIVKAEVKDRVRFERHNLLEDLGGPPFDCVFLNNVLMYFDGETKAKVVSTVVRAMKPGGFLVADPLEDLTRVNHSLTKRCEFLYQKDGCGG